MSPPTSSAAHARAAVPQRPWQLHAELFTTAAPGLVELAAVPDHRVKVHASAPVRGSCKRQRFVYTHGDIDLMPAGESDVWEERDAGTSLIVRLPPALLRRAAEDMGLDPDRAGIAPRHQFKDRHIEHIAWALDAERVAGHPNGRLYAECLGTALAVHLLGRYPAIRESVRGLTRPQLQRVQAYIEAHLDRDLSLERLAGVASLSASHFKTLFRRSMGMPVHAYVVQRRVERAKVLLQRSALPISQVALDAGFAHASHMARCMRRVLGVPPTALRSTP
jgi:AraC family transcriptional regulator